MGHVDTDDLALAALGVVGLAAVESGHLRSCPECATTLAGLRETVIAARGDGPSAAPLVEPPARVWQAVSAELGLPSPARPRRVLWVRRLTLAAAAVVIAVASLSLGLALGNDEAVTPTTVLAQAVLRPLDDDLAGSARWVNSAAGTVLQVEVSGAPLQQGYLEVWLLDPDSLRMVPLGALEEGVPATLTVPAGIRVSDYPTVDVSAEPLDNDPTHSGVSLARGELHRTG